MLWNLKEVAEETGEGQKNGRLCLLAPWGCWHRWNHEMAATGSKANHKTSGNKVRCHHRNSFWKKLCLTGRIIICADNPISRSPLLGKKVPPGPALFLKTPGKLLVSTEVPPSTTLGTPELEECQMPNHPVELLARSALQAVILSSLLGCWE